MLVAKMRGVLTIALMLHVAMAYYRYWPDADGAKYNKYIPRVVSEGGIDIKNIGKLPQNAEIWIPVKKNTTYGNKVARILTAENGAMMACCVLLVEEDTPTLKPGFVSRTNLMQRSDPVASPVPQELGQDLKEIKFLGKGVSGSVTLVQDKFGSRYALKKMKKTSCVLCGGEGKYYGGVKCSRCYGTKRTPIDGIMEEENILVELSRDPSPFVVTLVEKYDDAEHHYHLLELCSGGELFKLNQENSGFKWLNIEAKKFYAACMVEGLDHMHKLNVIHRDVKLSNVVLDGNGYAKITDFGLALKLDGATKPTEAVGTAVVRSPEMIKGDGYGKPNDWWAFGCSLYCLIFNRNWHTYPFLSKKAILDDELEFPEDTPISDDLKDLLQKLLCKDPEQRLGAAGIRSHAWFSGFKWNELQNRSMRAPQKPQK